MFLVLSLFQSSAAIALSNFTAFVVVVFDVVVVVDVVARNTGRPDRPDRQTDR